MYWHRHINLVTLPDSGGSSFQSVDKARLELGFFDRLSQRNVNVPLTFLLKGYTPDLCLAIHQLTDDGLARQLAGTVNILAEWLQAEVHACISLIQQNARDRKAARRLFLLQI